jgi:hypothetical protein
MKSKSFNNLLLFSLAGIALGFFGMLYEGLVTIPKMLDISMPGMVFWKDYYAAINPLIYYIPLVPLATLTLVVLYFAATQQKPPIKSRLAMAAILQIATLSITFYIIKIINPKLYFSDIAQYADVIPAKVLLVNILSIARLLFDAGALIFVFKAYLQTQQKDYTTARQ